LDHSGVKIMKPAKILAGIAGASALAGAGAESPLITSVSVIILAIGALLDRDQDGVPDFVERWRRKRRKRKLEDRVRAHTTITTMPDR